MRDSLLDEEYRSLRDELRVNRQYVFERPLLIVGVTLFVSMGMPETLAPLLIPLPFIVVLAFNLWFTFNRLQSSARILAYLQLVHEGASDARPSVGWETALALYRRFRQTLPVEQLEAIQRSVPPALGRDRLRFYPPIFAFHIAMAVVCVLSAAIYVLTLPDDARDPLLQLPLQIWIFVSVIVFLLFLLHAYARRPTELTDVLEEKVIWLAVFRNTDRLLQEEHGAGSHLAAKLQSAPTAAPTSPGQSVEHAQNPTPNQHT